MTIIVDKTGASALASSQAIPASELALSSGQQDHGQEANTSPSEASTSVDIPLRGAAEDKTPASSSQVEKAHTGPIKNEVPTPMIPAPFVPVVPPMPFETPLLPVADIIRELEDWLPPQEGQIDVRSGLKHPESGFPANGRFVHNHFVPVHSVPPLVFFLDFHRETLLDGVSGWVVKDTDLDTDSPQSSCDWTPGATIRRQARAMCILQAVQMLNPKTAVTSLKELQSLSRWAFLNFRRIDLFQATFGHFEVQFIHLTDFYNILSWEAGAVLEREFQAVVDEARPLVDFGVDRSSGSLRLPRPKNPVYNAKFAGNWDLDWAMYSRLRPASSLEILDDPCGCGLVLDVSWSHEVTPAKIQHYFMHQDGPVQTVILLTVRPHMTPDQLLAAEPDQFEIKLQVVRRGAPAPNNHISTYTEGVINVRSALQDNPDAALNLALHDMSTLYAWRYNVRVELKQMVQAVELALSGLKKWQALKGTVIPHEEKPDWRFGVEETEDEDYGSDGSDEDEEKESDGDEEKNEDGDDESEGGEGEDGDEESEGYERIELDAESD